MNETSFNAWFKAQEKPVESVSGALGVNRRTVYKWLKGAPVSPRNALKVSEKTGIPVERLIFRHPEAVL